MATIKEKGKIKKEQALLLTILTYASDNRFGPINFEEYCTNINGREIK